VVIFVADRFAGLSLPQRLSSQSFSNSYLYGAAAMRLRHDSITQQCRIFENLDGQVAHRLVTLERVKVDMPEQ